MTRKLGRALLTCLCLCLAGAPALALQCDNEAGMAAARQSRHAWAEWCTACGGEVVTGPECRRGPDWGGGRGAATGGMDPGARQLMEQSVRYGVQTNDVGGAAAGVGAALFLQGMQDAQRQAEAAARQRREAARLQAIREAEERERARQAQYNRIMAELGEDGTPALADVEGVVVEEPGAAEAALPAADAANPLGLMSDDALPARASADAGGRAIRGPALVPRPPAARAPVTHLPAIPVAAGPAAPGAATPPSPPPAPAPAPAPAPTPADTAPAVSQGIRDASQCLSPQTVLFCRSAADPARCQAAYANGYDSGSRQRDTVLQAAYAQGVADKRAGLPLQAKAAFNAPGATGGCRIEWINAYSRGHAEGR